MRPSAYLTAGALLFGTALGAADFLLTDNERPGWGSNTFPAGEPRLKTGATLSVVTDGAFASSPEFAKTAARPDGTFRALLDGRRGPEGDCQGFGSWQPKTRFESFVIDLKKPYGLTRAAVWAQFNKTQKSGDVEILVSSDGKTFVPAASGAFADGLSSEADKLGIPLELPFSEPVTAQYVQFRVKVRDGSPQQVISEVAVWGNEAGSAQAAEAIAVPVAPDVKISEKRLSGNPAGNTFPAGEAALATGATLSWVTDGPYATKSEEMLKTGSRPDGTCRVLLDGRRGTDGNCQAFGNWGGQYYATFTLDLKDTYLITRAAIWSQQTKTQGFETFELLLSADGAKFVSVGSINCPEGLLNQAEKLGEPVELKLEKPAAARYVRFRIKKHPARMQMILSEVAVWGDRLPQGADRTAYLPENQRPEVAVTGSGIGSSALTLDWSGFGSASQVKSYRVYRSQKPFSKITEEGVERIGEYPAATVRTVVYPLTPGETGSYGVTAVYDDGEYPVVKPFTWTAQGPIDVKTFGDMLAINHFWGGGGARHAKRTREWETVALDLLAETPFKTIRWWESYPEILKMLYERGIAATTFSGKRNYANGGRMGVHLYGAGNEPHLHGIRGADYAKRVADINRELKADVPHALLYAPTVCLDGRSLDFLEKFYAAGAKEHFDVLDIHNYLGNTADFVYPPGYPSGSPEGLFERIAKVREIMAKYGDAGKPMITTEFGYTDCNVANPVGEMTPERKAAFLVRGLIIQHVLGFRRVFVYSFWDEGEDPNYTEHSFGMLDYKGQKKPAYYASQVLGRELGKCVYDFPMKGSDEVNYGYVYRNPETDRFVTVVWNGASEMAGTFRTRPGTVTVVSMTGEKKEIRTAPDGSFRTVFGPAPVYLESAAPAELVKTVAVEEKTASDRVGLKPDSPVVVTGPGRKSEIGATLTNPTAETLEVHLSLETPEGKALASKTVKLAPGQSERAVLAVPAPAGLILDRYELAINYEGKYESRSDKTTLFVRRLAEKPGVTTGKMYGYQNDVYVLSDDTLEVTVDPQRGGRILEIFDRRTGANQITVPYDRLGGLHNIAFYYCIWDEVRAPNGSGIGRNTPYKIRLLPDGIEMSAENPGNLAAVKTLTLKGNGVLDLKVRLDSRSSRELACSWYMHPEYTVGGEAVSHSDLLTLPIGGKELEIPYWTGLGDRTTPEFSDGYWLLTSPSKHYRIRQDFSLDEFRKPRLWFGIGCCNFEMESSRDLKLAPGQSWTGDLKWTFSTLKQ